MCVCDEGGKNNCKSGMRWDVWHWLVMVGWMDEMDGMWWDGLMGERRGF